MTDSTISHNGALTTLPGLGGGIYANNSSPVTISNSTLSSNSASSSGGGLFCDFVICTLTNSTVSGNVAWSGAGGGGIYANGGDGLTLTDCTLSDNLALNYGGAILTRQASATLINSTLSGNSADYGGGIYADGDTVMLTNSTVSGNSADYGGGIYTDDGTVTLTNSTVSGNSADYKGGGLAMRGGFASIEANNTIVAGNTQVSGGDIDGGTLTGNYNLLSGDPLLEPLTDDGGATRTMLPQTGSPAIDAGACHDEGASTADGIPVTDQRGAPRPQGNGCDIGAVERMVSVQLRGFGYDDQRTLAGDTFSWPLVVQILDGIGGGVVGVVPNVELPTSGASAICASEATDATGIALVMCAANEQVGTYAVHISTPFGPNAAPLLVTYTLTNLPNDRIFGSGFEGYALPTGDTSP